MIIYKVTNLITNKSYIGQTIGYLSRRKKQHIYKSKNPKCYFHRAINKYGKDNFKWEILEKCDHTYQLYELEYHYIKQYNTKVPNGYNLTDGYDNSTYGLKLTKEQKLYLSKRVRGKNNPNYGNGKKIQGDKNPAKRPEVRKKISEAKKGCKRPDIASYRSKCYLIVNIYTGEEQIIYNLSQWQRDNPFYKMEGLKRVINGTYTRHKDIWVKRIE